MLKMFALSLQGEVGDPINIILLKLSVICQERNAYCHDVRMKNPPFLAYFLV